MMNSRQKLWSSSFFLQFQQLYIAIWLSKCLCETPLAQFFKFLDAKNKNASDKNFRKKTNTKNFCNTLLLIYGRCGIIFHISTIIFRNGNTTHSNEQNLIIFSTVFWKHFCGIPDTENTLARVQKCSWNDKNTKKWMSGHNTQCQNNQCHNTQCDI